MDILDQQFDVSNKANNGAKFTPIHPDTGKPLVHKADSDDAEGSPVTITLLGLDSQAIQKFKHKLSNQRIEDVARTGGKLNKVLRAEDLEEEKLAILVKATVAWHGFTKGGETYPCNEGNVRDLYTRHPWLREQVEAFISDRQNYLGN